MCTFISAIPKLHLESGFVCRKHHSVTLDCTILGDAFENGFDAWEYTTTSNTNIMLKGKIKERRSCLDINNCSLENAGQYVCNAWFRFNSTKFRLYSTSVLRIQGIYKFIKYVLTNHESHSQSNPRMQYLNVSVH